jgi:hypothetical protein
MAKKTHQSVMVYDIKSKRLHKITCGNVAFRLSGTIGSPKIVFRNQKSVEKLLGKKPIPCTVCMK